jgi:hypothetical protein
MRTVRFVAIAAAMLTVVMALPVLVRAQGMMGPGRGWGYSGQAPTAGPVTIDQAVGIARQALARLGNPDLVPVEVMEFTGNFYVVVQEKSTGIGAFELLIERNGFIRPEPGPNMMWNAKYGHMAGWGGYGMMAGYGMGAGMMGGYGAPGLSPTAPLAHPLNLDRARQTLQAWLNQAFPGAQSEEGMPFYGYFTFDFERNGTVLGMASVNAFTGQIWHHTWHGTFVQEKELK